MNVSSSLHKVPTAFNFDDPSYDKGGYTLFGAYAQVKITMVEGAHHHHPNPKRMSVIHHIQNPPTHPQITPTTNRASSPTCSSPPSSSAASRASSRGSAASTSAAPAAGP